MLEKKKARTYVRAFLYGAAPRVEPSASSTDNAVFIVRPTY
jgi:hypothetical protein